MKPAWLLISINLLLLVNHCQSNSQMPEEILEQGSTGILLTRLWNRLRNSTEHLIEEVQKSSRKHGRCSIHQHCSHHEYCSCSNYCHNTYQSCKKKRELEGGWPDDEKDYERSQRDCDTRRDDRKSDHRCRHHSDCGCNRRCSCHGYCAYICTK